MPRQEYTLSVFVASPGDVNEEREKLEEVIRELNFTWSRELGVKLELVRWETHAYPGLGADAQDVINEQIPDDYDLFIGIMWCRFGTPTGRAHSGTEEEFRRAKTRFNESPDSVKIMMYFKDEAVQPSQLDLEQLSSINRFRQSLGEEGVLYWRFEGLSDFETFVRMHLSRYIQTWVRQLQTPKQPAELKKVEVEQTEDLSILESDLGLFDFAEIFEERFAEVKEVTNRIASSTEVLGAKMTERTAEIADLPRDSQGNVNRQAARQLISRAATDMDQYTEQMKAVLPLFGSALNMGMDAFLKYIRLSVDLKDESPEAESGLDSVVELMKTMENSKQSMQGFRETVFSLPRMTSDLNRAKRGTTSVLDEFISELTTGQALLAEAEATLRHMYPNENNG